jgi:hypothetical protein
MSHYRLASADITHQFLDGEVVAIDFQTGHYHNLRGAAAQAFAALLAGLSEENLSSVFTDAPADAPALLQGLIDTWLKAGLLVAGSAATSTEPPSPVAWTVPTSEVFADMQQLLLADPIHDVGDNAWPRQATPPESP